MLASRRLAIPTGLSLAVVAVIIGGALAFSILSAHKEKRA
jgi:hypothetical protein